MRAWIFALLLVSCPGVALCQDLNQNDTEHSVRVLLEATLSPSCKRINQGISLSGSIYSAKGLSGRHEFPIL